MQAQALLACGLALVFGVALFLARKEGSRAAQIEALKAEIKKQAEEQQRAQKIIDDVNAMDANDARRRLREIANKQR